MFIGYAESYNQTWPASGTDAITTLTASDEFKVLSLTQLPLTNPPRTTYQDVVAFDNPASYWTMDESAASSTQPPAIAVTDPSVPLDITEDSPERKKLIDKTRKHWKKPVKKAPQWKKAKHHPPRPRIGGPQAPPPFRLP
jgi:hypothetical protein